MIQQRADQIRDLGKIDPLWHKLNDFLNLSPEMREAYANRVQGAVKELEKIQARAEVGENIPKQELKFITSFYPDIAENAQIQKRAQETLYPLQRWTEGILAFEKGISQGSKKDLDRAMADFSYLERHLPNEMRSGKNPIRYAISDLSNLLKYRDRKIKGNEITIEDTSDWRTLLNIGRLSKDLINCLIPNGDTKYTRGLIDLIASKNKRVLLAKNKKGEILSVAVVKVRQDENEKPVLHLERPFGIKGHSYQAQMLEHVKQKRSQMLGKSEVRVLDPSKKLNGGAGMTEEGQKTSEIAITRQIRNSKEKEKSIRLKSTGSFARYEHTEDLFDVWVEKNVEHGGLPVYP
ncbi:MAG: hypothetical protein JNK65_03255 [Deltaproteobacteria bacterium]|nr:hypothetical protein [Deltaproteobacteria bacterium]